MFHFTKDKSTFSRFALEMMAVDSNIRHLKKVGTNMDESIYNGVKAVIPEVKQLYCDRHLRQRDEKNLMRYLVQQNEVHRKEIAPRTKSRKIYMMIGKVYIKSSVWQSLQTNLISILNLLCWKKSGKVVAQVSMIGFWNTERKSLKIASLH